MCFDEIQHIIVFWDSCTSLILEPRGGKSSGIHSVGIRVFLDFEPIRKPAEKERGGYSKSDTGKSKGAEKGVFMAFLGDRGIGHLEHKVDFGGSRSGLERTD